MRRTCFEMLREIGYEIGLIQDLSITSFTDTQLRLQLLALLNRAKEWVVRNIPLDGLLNTTTIGTTAVYNTGTVSITQGTTQVTGNLTTFTAAMVGRKIQIGSSKTPYIIDRYTSPTVIQIDRPFIEASVTAGTYQIYQDVYQLPPAVSGVFDIRDLSLNRVLNRKTVGWIMTRYPDPLTSTGQMRYWANFGERITREPSGTTNYSADAGTGETAIVDAGLASTYNQAYKDWLVYNATRSMSAVVSDYNGATTTITLNKAITNQTTTDAYYLQKREISIILRPSPLSAYPLSVTYNRSSQPFVNDYDYETDIDEDYETILIFRAVAEYYLPRDANKASVYVTEANGLADRLVSFNEDLTGAQMAFVGDSVDRYRDNYIEGGVYSLRGA